MKTVLITGITGYISQYLLLTRPNNVQIIGTKRSVENSFVFNDHEVFETQPLFLENSISSQLKNVQPDIVIHTAAMAGLGQCQKNKELARRINSSATAELANWCAEGKIRMIYLSTDIVFKGDQPPYQENDHADPVNVYGLTKLLGEEAVKGYLSNYAICRISLTLGKGLSGTNNFIDWFYSKLQKKETVNLFQDEIRTATYAEHLAEKIWEIALSDANATFHLAGAHSLDRVSLGKLICDHLGYGHELLEAISLTDMQDYPRPVDVSLTSTRRLNGKKFQMEPVQSFIAEIVKPFM